jgi:hypothetical protein
MREQVCGEGTGLDLAQTAPQSRRKRQTIPWMVRCGWTIGRKFRNSRKENPAYETNNERELRGTRTEVPLACV